MTSPFLNSKEVQKIKPFSFCLAVVNLGQLDIKTIIMLGKDLIYIKDIFSVPIYKNND